MLTPDALMGTALTAARQAAGVIRTSPPGNLTPKGPRDVTSEVDFAVETQLRDYLRSQTPSIGFLGEEGGVSGPDDLVWILDPIDGTVNFTRGLPLCGVSLALARGQWPILGVVSFPFLNMQYTASRVGVHFGTARGCASARLTIWTTLLLPSATSLWDYRPIRRTPFA